MTEAERLLAKRKWLWHRCQTPRELQLWLQGFLDVDLPQGHLDPESNSSPLEALWELYDGALRGTAPSRTFMYGPRGGYKTLTAAVLEVLALFHLDRDVAHMAAIVPQAKKAQSYVKTFFAMEPLSAFVTQQNESMVEIAYYHHRDLDARLTVSEWEALLESDRVGFRKVTHYVKIVPCTMQGANSEHVTLFIVDEIDVVPTQHLSAYEEAKHIPKGREGVSPITLLLSTRKFNFGLAARELDEAATTQLAVRHWNEIDVTATCAPDRHQPQGGRESIYFSRDTLRALSRPDWANLPVAEQEKYQAEEGFSGCVRNCKLYAICRGRLARGTSRHPSRFLGPIKDLQVRLGEVTVEHAKAQIMCWKPESTGLIYGRFDRDVHMLTLEQMAAKIVGVAVKCDTKEQLVQLAQFHGLRKAAGLDWGFTHAFVVVSAILVGRTALIFDVISASGLELEDKIEVCRKTLTWEPDIWPDPESPDSILTFRRKGFRMRAWDKGPGSVEAGIEAVRTKLMPASGTPEMFLLKGDEGCELLAKRLGQYHFQIDAAGRVTDIPAKENDDEADGVRYLIQNEFPIAGRGRVAVAQDAKPEPPPQVAQARADEYTPQSWMKKVINENLGVSTVAPGGTMTLKKGRFYFSQ